MPIAIADEIWQAWEAEDTPHDLPLGMLLTSSASPEEAGRAVERAYFEVHARLEASALNSGSDDPEYLMPGVFDWVETPMGVFCGLGDTEIFEQELREIMDVVAAQGIDGSLTLWSPPECDPPRFCPLLECRVRVRGERERRKSGDYLWYPDVEAEKVLLRAAAEWRRAIDGDAQVVLDEAMYPFPFDDEPMLDRQQQRAVDRKRGFDITATTAVGVRAVSGHGYNGSVSLDVGGASVTDAWADELDELVAFLAEHAPLIAYGCIRRGWMRAPAARASAPGADWPARPDSRPGTASTQGAFEDVYAPDIFGVQLLGARYHGRWIDDPRWNVRTLGKSALISATDLDVWFAEPPLHEPTDTTQATLTPAARPMAELERARRDHPEILYRRGVLSAGGYADGASGL